MKTANEARLNKQLEKLYRSNGKIVTLRDLLAGMKITGKKIHTQEYSSKKVNLEYKRLSNPKKTYYVKYLNDGVELLKELPKIVFDSIEQAADLKELLANQ